VRFPLLSSIFAAFQPLKLSRSTLFPTGPDPGFVRLAGDAEDELFASAFFLPSFTASPSSNCSPVCYFCPPSNVLEFLPTVPLFPFRSSSVYFLRSPFSSLPPFYGDAWFLSVFLVPSLTQNHGKPHIEPSLLPPSLSPRARFPQPNYSNSL